MGLEQLQDFVNDSSTQTKVIGGVIAATVGIVAYRLLFKRNAKKKTDYPRDTVILHQIGRGPYAPSMTPFAVKLETYLRMAKIPYKNEHDMVKSSKGKFPWMEYNGLSVADSSFCIAHLNKVRGVDLNAKLTASQKGVAVAFQRLVEDSLYWALVMQRWVQEGDPNFVRMSFKTPLPASLLLFLAKRMIGKTAWGQGMGRHSREEVLEIARKDLTAIADFIGDKKFLMGDQPCEGDCTVFGMLSQVYWHMPTQTLGKIFKDEFPTLVAYCDRMKTTFWPDWDDCITHGGTRTATK